jgi:hypothetical protein
MRYQRILNLALLGAIALAVTYTPAQSQDEEYEARPNRRDRRGGIVGGGGGIFPTWSFFNTSTLNNELTAKGLPALSEDGMFMFGGHGYFYVMFIPNLRVGGMGFGGAMETRRDVDGRYQSSRLDVSSGGVTLEYVLPLGRLHFVLGAMVGGGSYTLTLTQSDNVNKNWGSLFPATPASAVDSRHEVVNRFFALQPSFGIEYEINPFIVAGLNAGYFGSFGDAWRLDDNFELLNMPELKLGGAFARLSLTVGLFLGEN